ncbi:uncharacterized protein LOC127281120 isoform X1 [Leptopilina boulardi]|uniref:uncharacterized protein LOC127281120 isoform X1 n=1 Tax=Leptopilina boulardi TaxID=63433 RepID=UPI0021F6436C|nr:uncharacterized protein LOC127281120 isoform X1 [Leptopilina boulardi]XP_051160595.1 uncharacterized protein LOC127281120 isoform X1 [Leptopilina boulardi]
MNYSKDARFFPNECYICKSQKKLTRCQCNMIAYCSENHRLQHLSMHKKFCQTIRELLKEKKIQHIYEELISLFGVDWTKKREELRQEIIKNLKRPMTPLELTMWRCPRVCFVCFNSKQEELKNCPNCPVASFCQKHPNDKIHSKNCLIMNNYLKFLTNANQLNIDLQFLSSDFPFIANEKKKIGDIDRLTYTFLLNDTEANSQQSILLKANLFKLTDIASKLNCALLKINETIPEEIIIHFDVISYKPEIMENNYWEFLLHLNENIKKLTIIITGHEYETYIIESLCEKCVMEKKLNIEFKSMSYEKYLLSHDYKKPNILFYSHPFDDVLQFKKWKQIKCPILMPIDSKFDLLNINIIYQGQINTPFNNTSSFIKNENFVIFTTTNNKSVKEKISSSLMSISNITLSEFEDNNYFNVKEEKQNFQFEFEKEKNFSENESKENNSVELYQKKNSIKKLKQDFSFEKIKNIEEQKVKSISPSSSVCSFIVISEPGDNDDFNEEKIQNTKVKIENKSLSESQIELLSNSNEQNYSQSFLVKYISYLKNENEGLRQQLNSSVEEITKLQEKVLEFEKITSHYNKKKKLIKKISLQIADIIDNVDDDNNDNDEKIF